MKCLKISTAQIAKICNVSQGTVDRALNDRADINAETKQKILEVAKQYGFRNQTNPISEKLEGTIGVIVFNLNNEFFSDLITEIEYALREEKLGAVVMMSHYDKRYEIECIKNLYNTGVRGIILCSSNNDPSFENYLKLFDIPIIAVGNKINSLPYVGIDDFAAMKEMTARVLSDNPKNIVYFSPALNYSDAYAQRRRYEGFLNAVGKTKYSVVTNIDDVAISYAEDTAVLCSNDYYALKVYLRGCNAKIFGFDNIGIINKFNISIDSVDYSVTEIAKEAIRAIKENRKSDTYIPYRIIKRNNDE